MAEANYTIKLTRQELNEIATALEELRLRTFDSYSSLHPDDTARNGYQKRLNTIDTLRSRLG